MISTGVIDSINSGFTGFPETGYFRNFAFNTDLAELKKDKNIDISQGENLTYWGGNTFESLFDEYYSPLCLFVNTYLKDLDLSRSLVQQLFVDLWVKRKEINIQGSVKHYLFTAAKNRSIDHLRESKRSVQLTEVMENNLQTPFEDKIAEAELNDRINKLIDELPEKCREIFLMCRFDGLKYAQIAEKLNISVKTVEMQMGIALKKMRDKLSDIQMFRLMLYVFYKKI